VAAPSPAPQWGQTHFLVLSGDDGTNLGFQPPEQHPGFAKDILAYDTTADTWTEAGQVPATQVTVPAVAWNEQYVFPNGEIRPGVRTPEIWSLSFPGAPASRHTSKN
jgi:N-acetylneuraminic acid mutarotase